MSLPPNLAHHIRVYLTGSEVDLQTVSAKQIRTKLATIYPDLDIKALRSEIDGISIPIFHEIKENFEAAAREAEKKASAKPIPAVKPSQVSKPSGSLPTLALPSRGTPAVVTNTKLVEKNPNPPAPTSTTSTTNQKTPKPASSKTRKRKSAVYVDTDDEDGPEDGSSEKKTKPKKPKAPKRPRPEGEGPGSNKGIHVELNCSTALAELIGVPMCSRPQVVKKIWEHIKSNGLQNPSDKRQILCDEAMKKVFNTNSVHMFTMNKLLADHLYKTDEAIQKPQPPE